MYVLLERSKKYLTLQQYRTIKGQIKAGDIEGARVGLLRMLNKKKKVWNEKKNK